MLYRPERYEYPMAEAIEFVRALRFGLLVSQLDGELQFSHLPLLVDVADGAIVRLRGHFARANPHWRALAREPSATVVFSGANAYISAQWYAPGCQAAPTWNYTAVHVNGRVRLLDTLEQTGRIVDELIAVNEADLPSQWDSGGYSPERRAALMPHILGFALDVTAVLPKFKLGQHHASQDRLGAIAGLRSRGTADALEIAALMERTMHETGKHMDTARRLAAQADGDVPSRPDLRRETPEG